MRSLSLARLRDALGAIIEYAALACRALREEGVLRAVWHLAEELAFDRLHGMETWRPRRPSDAECGEGTRGDAVRYQGAEPGLVRAILEWLPWESRVGRFVDLGCGKGRVLVLAAEAGFCRLTGVELSPELADACQRNLDRWVARRAEPGMDVGVCLGNAAAMELPSDMSVTFLYNPFGGTTLERVVDRLAARACGGAEGFWVVYVNPVGIARFEAAGFGEVASWHRRGRCRAVVLAWRPGQGVSAQCAPGREGVALPLGLPGGSGTKPGWGTGQPVFGLAAS